jgi:hypothetical protein
MFVKNHFESLNLKLVSYGLGMVVYTCNLCIQEAEAEGSPVRFYLLPLSFAS